LPELVDQTQNLKKANWNDAEMLESIFNHMLEDWTLHGTDMVKNNFNRLVHYESTMKTFCRENV
jgi:hypothetical protein